LEPCSQQAGFCLRQVQHHEKVAGELVLLEWKLEKRDARVEKSNLRIHYVFTLRNEAVEGLALSRLRLFGNVSKFAVMRENLLQLVQCDLPPIGVFVSQFQTGDGSGQGKASDVGIVDHNVEITRAMIVPNSHRLECDLVYPQMYLPYC
jgi:hypothetical protein